MNVLYTEASNGIFSKLLKQILLLTPFKAAFANGLYISSQWNTEINIININVIANIETILWKEKK